MRIHGEGNAVVLQAGPYELLFSYGLPVAAKCLNPEKGWRVRQKYSPTTSKHINNFLMGSFEIYEVDQLEFAGMVSFVFREPKKGVSIGG